MLKKLTDIGVGVIIALLVAAVIGWWNISVDVSVLKSQVNSTESNQGSLSTRINKLENDYSRLIGFIQGKLNFNYQEYVDISNNKNISNDKFTKGLQMLEKNPKAATDYFKSTLQFTPNEIKAVLTLPKN